MRAITEVRDELLDFVKKDLIGPAHGEHEELQDQPRIRYTAGVLFPQECVLNESAGTGGIEDGDDDRGPGVGPDDDKGLEPSETVEEEAERKGALPIETDHDETIVLANSYRPSAMGMSFMLEKPSGGILVDVSAALYSSAMKPIPEGDTEYRYWTRNPLDVPQYRFDEFKETRTTADVELHEGLKLRITCRPRTDGRYLITTSIYNSTMDFSTKKKTFFQVGILVRSVDGSACIVEYQSIDELGVDEEELALAMLYRRRRVYGIGHGCAVSWEEGREGKAVSVATDTLPSVVVPPVVPRSDSADFLSMQYLSGDCPNPTSDIPEALEQLCLEYQQWIVKREAEAESLELVYRSVADNHIQLCKMTLQRMRAGISYLKSDDHALEAFMLVNLSMLMQQYHSKLRRKLNDEWVQLPNKYTSDWKAKRGYWRTFQLAFILISLTSFAEDDELIIVDGEEVSARDLVDLIWFPTGGGKTEAYLGVTAFVIFLERLSGKDVEGCRVLMRYTLRLLTSQQFQRAASLICACEYIRREDKTNRLGVVPITIGLWVGMSLTPNEEKDALAKLSRLVRKKGDAKNPFQLLSCPWCGTELNNPKGWGYVEHKKRLLYRCPSKSAGDAGCPFSSIRSALPINVVDESIYASPPTMLIGTVDKFAMLAWREKSGRIFTVGEGPKLIIQDELHLITGPLGSMVGLYESVIDYLCSLQGRRPKIIASTATIRRAAAQCKALYDRPMFQFPPPGLDISNSFFAKEDRKLSPGRQYVGVLPTATSSALTAQVRTVVSLQQGAFCVVDPEDNPESEALMDPYWTLIQYFGSLKELGRAATFVTADIPEFLPTMFRRYDIPPGKKRYMNNSEELTSRKNEDEIPRILKRLETSYRFGKKWDDQAYDTVLATNMISVGVDVDRLGLMLVVTQPKGTSEYIQASSRVGRSNDSPGLIVTLYNASRPRDRSHYEQFRSYHDSFYRFVEPTSVTPFSPPAMERALHAVLVIAGRHIAGWSNPPDYDSENQEFADFLSYLRERVQHIDPDHLSEFDHYVEDRLDFWRQNSPDRWGFLNGSRDVPTLMHVAGSEGIDDDQDSLSTPTSLRNVDVECTARVIPRYQTDTEVVS